MQDHEKQELQAQLDTLGAGEFLKVTDIAEFMRVSKMTIYRLIHNGELPSSKIGRSFRVSRVCLFDYLTAETLRIADASNTDNSSPTMTTTENLSIATGNDASGALSDSLSTASFSPSTSLRQTGIDAGSLQPHRHSSEGNSENSAANPAYLRKTRTVNSFPHGSPTDHLTTASPGFPEPKNSHMAM